MIMFAKPAVCVALAVLAAQAAIAKNGVPRGFFNARPAEHLVDAWRHKSLWIPEPAFIGGARCFDFRDFEDCVIYEFDKNLEVKEKGGRLCEVKEYIAEDSPGMRAGDYGLVIGGIGVSYNEGFPERVSAADTEFQSRGGLVSFELFEGPCLSRAAGHGEGRSEAELHSQAPDTAPAPDPAPAPATPAPEPAAPEPAAPAPAPPGARTAPPGPAALTVPLPRASGSGPYGWQQVEPDSAVGHLWKLVKVVDARGDTHKGMLQSVRDAELVLKRASRDGGGTVRVSLSDVRSLEVLQRGR
jgi:hypothetical protein